MAVTAPRLAPPITQAKASAEPRVEWLLLTFVAAIAVRVALAPLVNHTWDTHTWWNVFVDLDNASNPLAAIRAPYHQMEALSLMARAEQRGWFYEYWAYPPGMLYIFYPLAKIYGAFEAGLAHQFASAYSFTVIQIPMSFLWVYKLPNLVFDLTIGGLLWRMAGPKAAAWFLFNPYVLLVSNWTFDGAMVASTVAAIYLQERDRTVPAAVALAIGASIKFVPAFLAPAFVLYLFNRRGGSLRDAAIFSGVFIATLLVLVAPVIDLMPFVLGFHSQRPGGGLTWYTLFQAAAAILPGQSWSSLGFYSGQIGSFVLPLGMLFGFLYLARKTHLSINQACLCMALVYLGSTKLVNEAYLLIIVALLAVEAARRRDPLLYQLRTLFWVIPFAWAMINVPWQGLLAYFYVLTRAVTPDAMKAWADLHYCCSDSQFLIALLAVMGAGCSLLYVWAVPVIARQGEHPERE